MRASLALQNSRSELIQVGITWVLSHSEVYFILGEYEAKKFVSLFVAYLFTIFYAGRQALEGQDVRVEICITLWCLTKGVRCSLPPSIHICMVIDCCVNVHIWVLGMKTD